MLLELSPGPLEDRGYDAQKPQETAAGSEASDLRTVSAFGAASGALPEAAGAAVGRQEDRLGGKQQQEVLHARRDPSC